ncbi:GntR family transcriptional regulator [Bosea sp. (in: a-proteobacteria)]|uniref:GntR family transcriptional regulator n=1 Tax=Bosea sp. (in: a-proteobacteria) TaxID=1871050 RepID=UPI002629A16C|nr:GntR family transcriptional regulator [Bosea sp. (in: a-proteobacteria)]MCO5092145.1 GntR family transcriptional regulator [Bosea sp. (in: a-proteobacteria)]
MRRIRQTPQQLAYEYLRNQIVSGQFPGDMRLKSESIAEVLGLSRMPVREALRQLDAEGLVTLRPNRGAVVTNLTPEDILELFEMRAALEALAAGLAARKANADDLAALDSDLVHMARIKPDHMQWVVEHDRFHDRICLLSGRQRLCNLISNSRQQVRPYIRLYVGNHVEPELVGHEHRLILDCLRARDPARAETVMRDHVMHNGETIVAALKGMRPVESKVVPQDEAGPRPARAAGDIGAGSS